MQPFSHGQKGFLPLKANTSRLNKKKSIFSILYYSAGYADEIIMRKVRGTYLSYLRNLIFDEHVFIQLKEKRTVSRFYFYKRVGPDSPGETFRVLKEKEERIQRIAY